MELTSANRPDLLDLLEADADTRAAVLLKVVRAACSTYGTVPPGDAALISQDVFSGPHGVTLRLGWDDELPPATP